MGLRDFLGKKAGASGYGSILGRSAVENGIAIGRIIYLGHGTRDSDTTSTYRVFDSAEQMQTEGFALYCHDELHRPPAENQSELSVHCRAAGIAYATQVATSPAWSFSTLNREEFLINMERTIWTTLTELNTGVQPILFHHYTNLRGPGYSKLLNLESPGTGDVLDLYLSEVSKHSFSQSVGFLRFGTLGFGEIVTELKKQTAEKMCAAKIKYGW
jgi:hypothetical protein